VDSEETPEQGKKMPAIAVDAAQASQDMLIKITSRLDGFDIKLGQLNTSLTDLSTSVSSITTHQSAPSLDEVTSVLEQLLNQHREKQVAEILKSDTINGIADSLKQLCSMTPRTATHSNRRNPSSPTENTFQGPSPVVYGNVYAEQGVDKSLSSAMRHVAQSRQDNQSNRSGQSFFQNVTRATGNHKSPIQFFTPANPKTTGEEKEIEEIDFQQGQVSNLTDNTQDSDKSPLKPTALEPNLDNATGAEEETLQEDAADTGATEHHDGAADESLQVEVAEQPTEESRTAQSTTRRSKRIQNLNGSNNAGNQTSDEPQEETVARATSSAQRQNDIRNYF
jgi:hypothetical protein